MGGGLLVWRRGWLFGWLPSRQSPITQGGRADEGVSIPAVSSCATGGGLAGGGGACPICPRACGRAAPPHLIHKLGRLRRGVQQVCLIPLGRARGRACRRGHVSFASRQGREQRLVLLCAVRRGLRPLAGCARRPAGALQSPPARPVQLSPSPGCSPRALPHVRTAPLRPSARDTRGPPCGNCQWRFGHLEQ